MFNFISFIAAFFLSLFLTWIVRNICFKHNIVSIPRARDIHKKPIPRIGGIAIFVSFLIVSLVAVLTFGEQIFDVERNVLAIWIGGIIISGSMLFDDLYDLKAWQKFVFQFIAVFVIIAAGIGIDALPNPFTGKMIDLNSVYIPIFHYNDITYHFSLWSDLITLVWLVGMMNIINFVDGVDGLAGGVSFIALITIFLLSVSLGSSQNQTAMTAIILAGSVLGFLFWNFPPAKIFMGDTGAMFLGFMLGTLTLVSGGKLATVFLVLGFPIVDGLFVAFGRLLRHQNPFNTPDKTHLHHRFLKVGLNARQSILIIYFISIAFAWVALRSTTHNKMIASFVLVALLMTLIFILNRIANRKGAKI